MPNDKRYMQRIGIKNAILTRVRLMFALAMLLALGIFFRIAKLQWSEGEKWLQMAQENSLKYFEVEANRGNILSANGTLLATSLPFYQIALDPTVASDELFYTSKDTLSFLLARYFKDRTAEQYDSLITQARKDKKRYLVLNRQHVKYIDKKEMEKWPLFSAGRAIGGVIFERQDKRFKPYDELARRTIGFTKENEEDNSVNGRGLEYSFNKQLAGVNGQMLYQRMSNGQWKPLDEAAQANTETGMDIQTTLDIELQDFATRTLRNALTKHRANYGTVIVMEVQTGHVKAAVNLGRSGGKYYESYNYAVGSQGVTEPGSTFKLASMMAVLEEGGVTLLDTVNAGRGSYSFYEECVMTDATNYGYGPISIQTAFEKSSNIGISKLVYRHFREKPQKFIEYLDKFWITRPLGVQLQGEGLPFINRPGESGWSGCSLPWLAIGYEVKVSPLQMLALYNAIANNGKMIQPMFVTKVFKGNKVIENFPTVTLSEKICSDKTLTTLQKMLEGVVERGTARDILSPDYRIAGKTGTTQKIKNGRYTKSYYTSFAGYFPADQPKYSIIVAIDEPTQEEQYGGKVAAPVFREISDYLFASRMSLSIGDLPAPEVASLPVIRAGFYDDLQFLCKKFGITQVAQEADGWVSSKASGDTVEWKNRRQPEGLVPDVHGMALRDALFLLENKGLQVKTFGKGRVVNQSLNPGARYKKGNTIFLRLG